MKILNYLIIIFICINHTVKADSKQTLINELQKGGKLIFIRHAIAPGGGDPDDFDINDCKTQRNLSDAGRIQSKKIGNFFKANKIPFSKVYSSEWCRCKETALLAFEKYETKNFLNSFFSQNFANNREKQIIDFNKFIANWDQEQNLIFVTHYVVISEILKYAPSSGEIVISNKNYKLLGSISNIK